MGRKTDHVQFIWSIAEVLRGRYKPFEYGHVILPFTVLRRLDLVLAPTRQAVLDEAARVEGLDFDPDLLLRKAADQRFYNTSELDLEKVVNSGNTPVALRSYVRAFSPTVREIFEAFRLDEQITRLHKSNLLYLVLTKFLDAELDPETVSPTRMGDMFEELIRRFSEASNEQAGEHFTPREVVRLCAELVLAGDTEVDKPGAIRKVYDPACGTGGMLTATEELVRDRNSRARLYLYGQELNPETWAIARSEMLLKDKDPSNIYPHSTLSADGLPEDRFDLMLANPPFGVDWEADHDAVLSEHSVKGEEGRFGVGTPPKDDGSLLFLQNMLAKRKSVEEGGSRIAIVFNGSPLFSGGAGSGPSEIRRWILENDWLEAIVALPEQLFYNTGIATYVWVLTNRKSPQRKGRIQLIDARSLWEPMVPKSLGDKRRRLSDDHIEAILDIYKTCQDEEHSKLCDNNDFMFRRITVERPLRLRYEVDEGAASRLKAATTFKNLVKPRANVKDRAKAVERGEAAQKAILDGLEKLKGFASTDPDVVDEKLTQVLEPIERPTPTLRRAVKAAISRSDPEAPIVRDRMGAPEPDPDLRDYENVPLQESVDDYIEREVLPFAEDAWVDGSKNKIGTEIPLTRLFYRYEPPRPLEEIDSEIQQLEGEIAALVADVADHAAD
jgi:type I restriction enzyme M protein